MLQGASSLVHGPAGSASMLGNPSTSISAPHVDLHSSSARSFGSLSKVASSGYVTARSSHGGVCFSALDSHATDMATTHDSDNTTSSGRMDDLLVRGTRKGRSGEALHAMDVLDRSLVAVFCGINRPPSATLSGHNFSNRSNRFWTVLHRAGFTDRELQPHEERRLLEYGYGITAVVHRSTRRADELSPQEFKLARASFDAQMRRYAPRAIGFLGKRAYAGMLGVADVDWGPQPTGFAGAMAWVLPNPSGLNRGFTLDALVTAYSDFRRTLTGAG